MQEACVYKEICLFLVPKQTNFHKYYIENRNLIRICSFLHRVPVQGCLGCGGLRSSLLGW